MSGLQLIMKRPNTAGMIIQNFNEQLKLKNFQRNEQMRHFNLVQGADQFRNTNGRVGQVCQGEHLNQ